MIRLKKSIQRDWEKAKMRKATMVPETEMMRRGRLPQRSESRPMMGAASIWARALAVRRRPTWVGLALNFSAI